VKTPDLPRTLDRLELFQDEWGYLLLWATLAAACLLAAVLIALPVIFGWRVVFSRSRGKLGTILYFACLGLGYIMVEVGLIGRFTLALTNPTVSASALITGMLFFSGLGSLVSERFVDAPAPSCPWSSSPSPSSSSPTAACSIRFSTRSGPIPTAGVSSSASF
jgi:hypothetical protein